MWATLSSLSYHGIGPGAWRSARATRWTSCTTARFASLRSPRSRLNKRPKDAAAAQGKDAETEPLRLRVQKYLADHREHGNLTRPRFAAILDEMGFSKNVGPSWKRTRAGGRDVWVVIPSLLPKTGKSATGANLAGASATLGRIDETAPNRIGGPKVGGRPCDTCGTIGSWPVITGDTFLKAACDACLPKYGLDPQGGPP